mgnify:CR=1 FL=1
MGKGGTKMGKSTDITADRVKSCASCGKCSKSCPAHIDISDALGIYEEYLSGDVRTLEKSDGMESSGKPVDCIECGACTAHCPCGLDVKELMRELAMMQSCGRLMKFPYNGKVCKELLSGQSTPAKKF